MFKNRTLRLSLSVLLVLLITSCSQGSKELVPATDTLDFAAGTFELSELEQAAIAKGDKSSLTVDFGDPALGQPVMNVPPTPEQIARLQGAPMPELESAARSASTWGNWNRCKQHRKWNCDPCKEKKKCRKVTGICNRSERFWKVADCCSQTADVQYAAEVQFDDEGGDLSGVEVIFSRDGVEVGRAKTGNNGFAYFTEKAVSRGPHSVKVCVASSATVGDCKTNDCKPKPKYCKHGKRNCNYKSCKPSKDDCDNCGRDKDDCKNKCYGSKGSSTYSKDKCKPTPPPCKPCTDKVDKCEPCSTTAENGFFCSSIDYAVYTDCIQGAVTGNGYFPSCNPLRVGLRDYMNFRVAYDQGAVQGYLNFSGGQYAGAPKVVNGQVKWLLISGVESWFGGDNFMVHVIDGGNTFRDDYFEIWLEDPVTCTTYCCGGNLTGCYVHVSYRYSQKCP
jgi:hypothetical protein